MSLDGVTLDQLRTLRVVAEAGSFSAGARALGITQAAVSQAMERLEAQLGLRLFDRSGRTARLTSHGASIVAGSAGIDAELRHLGEIVEGLAKGRESRLSIVVDTMFPTSSLVDFARAVGREHPTVELLVLTETLSSVSALVRDKSATLGVAIEDADLDGLNQRRIADVRLIPVAAASHPLARAKGPLDARDLAGAVQIVMSERTKSDVDRGVLSSRTWRVVDLPTKHALILHGLGFGHLPEHLIRDDLRTKRLVPLPLAAWGGEEPRRGLFLVSRKGAVLGPVARWAESQLTRLCRRVVEHHTK